MKLLTRFLSAALLLAPLLRAEPGQPPPSIVLPDNVATTATGLTAGGKPWGYVVVQPSDPAAFAGKKLRLHLKSGGIGAAGNFAPLGEIQPVTHPATLQVLMQRAATLGDDPGTVNGIIDTLVKEWALSGEALRPAHHHRLAALVNRAATSERDAATLRALSLNHPTFRLALGLAWGGPLPVTAGTLCTVEVREVAPDGSDLGVVGRCEFTAGQMAALAVPSPPVQVPDLSAQGHLTVKLRWAVPDALRRQALQTTGFRVWRVPSTTTLPNPPTLAQLQAAAGVKQVTLAPVLLGKLFTTANAADFTADPDTFFVADDNGRDDFIDTQTTPGGPPILQRTGVPHVANTQYTYYVAALDWLKQPGPPSGGGTGIAVRTLPPPVPQNLLVEEKHLGTAAENLRLQLSFDRNATAAGDTTPTHRYAIYRGDSTAQSLDKRNYLLPRPEVALPAGEAGLSALTTLNQPASGRLAFLDSSLLPAGNVTSTFWYSVRAIHDTPLGPVYSAPSAPVFGTFHDHRGPAAPGGSVHTDPLRALCREDAAAYVSSEAMPASESVAGNGRVIRIAAKRLDPGVVAVQFFIIDPRTENSGTGPVIVFGPDNDELVFDTIYLDPTSDSRSPSTFILGAACLARNGTASYIAWRPLTWGQGGIVTSTTQRTRITFECASSPTSQLTSTSPLSGKMLETPPTPTLVTEGDTVRATFSSAIYHGRTAVITTTRGGVTRRQAVKITNTTVTFADPGRSAPGAPATTTSFRVVRTYQPHGGSNPTADQLPPAWPPGVNWPPLPPENEHVAGEIANTATVSVTTTPETREYQIYRQVDSAPMTLIAEGVSEHETSALKEIVVADTPNLPVSGRIGYFARLVDRHGNASPLKQIGPYIDLLAPTPVPVLNEPVAAGNSASPKMQLSWFCPPHGVRRFHVRLVDLTSGTVVANAPGTAAVAALAGDPLYANPSTPGKIPTVTGQGTSFATNLTATLSDSAGAPSVHTAEFTVQLDHEYQVEIEAIGLKETDRPRSLPRKFTWRAPVASGAVAWPARPLPKVINGVPLNFQARDFHPSNAYFSAAFASPSRHYDTDATPVLVPLGLVPVLDYDSENTGAFTPLQMELGMPNYQVNPDSPFYRGAIDPNAHVFPIASSASATQQVPLLPVVLYRQIVSAQGTDFTNLGEMVQCSPMITRIAWRNDAGRPTIVDPLIVTLPSYSGNTYSAVSFWLPDTKPVVPGYTYRYFLVRFFPDTGEIDQVIDCGTVTPTP